ncbi:unnamed protein product [marine sediment metagenome]|uniref:Uncharacterized protein n=1 Tax=marine sediment metagenome TaxID=412755 RepID=X0UV70_9ZZZZ
MFDIQFTHSASNGSSAKCFIYTLVPGSIVTEKIPPQAQHIIELAYNLSLTKQIFTYNDLIHYIDECCAYDGTVFTRSKGGTERIVRYYSALLQSIGALTDFSTCEDYMESEED